MPELDSVSRGVLALWLVSLPVLAFCSCRIVYLGQKYHCDFLFRKFWFLPRSIRLWLKSGVANFSFVFYSLSAWFAFLSAGYYALQTGGGEVALTSYLISEPAWSLVLGLALVVIPTVAAFKYSDLTETPEAFSLRTSRSYKNDRSIVLISNMILDELRLFMSTNERVRDEIATLYETIALPAEQSLGEMSEMSVKSDNFAGYLEALNLHFCRMSTSPDSEPTDVERKFKQYEIVISQHLVDRAKKFKQIEALKNAISEELGIHPRHFCDKLMGFSPSLASARWNKIEANLRLIRVGRNRDDFARVIELIVQTHKIFEWSAKLERDQMRLLGCRKSLKHLCNLLADKSMSSAIHTYAYAVEQASKQDNSSFIDRFLNGSEAYQRLLFLFERQFACSKFSPHYLLMSLFHDQEKQATQQDEKYVLLKKIAEDSVGDNFEKKLTSANAKPEETFKALLSSTNKIIYGKRNEVRRDCLDNYVTQILSECGGHQTNGAELLVLTSGYGKLERVVVAAIAKKWCSDREDIRIRHFCHIKKGEKYALSSRMLRHELNNEVRTALAQPHYLPTEIGDAELMLKHLPDTTRVVCLFGADILIDSKRREVLSSCGKELLTILEQSEIPNNKKSAIGLIEDYKQLESVKKALPWSPWVDQNGQPYSSPSEATFRPQTNTNLKMIIVGVDEPPTN